MNLYADDLAYVHHTGFADLARGAARFLVDELAAKNARVADLGCGSGLLARPLVDAGCDVTCVDISPAMLALAKRHVGAKRARFVRASLYDVDAWRAPSFAPFDAVLSVGEPLSYLAGARTPPLARFFRDVARVVRPGGAFIFDLIVRGRPSLARRTFVADAARDPMWTTCVATDDDGDTLTRDITTFTRVGARWRRGREVHRVRVVDVADVRAALRSAGFTCRVRTSYGDHPLAVRRRAFLCTRT